MPTHPFSRAPDHRNDDGAGPQPEGAAASGRAAPLLDPRALQQMEEDFQDTGVVARFVRDFSLSLDEKIDRLDQRLRSGDASGADQATFSLSTSAAMIGAGRLEVAARAARQSLTGHDDSVRLMAELRACAADTVRELELAYPRRA